MIRKLTEIFVKTGRLIGENKFFFWIPTFILLAMLIFLIFYIGPASLKSFIYAGF